MTKKYHPIIITLHWLVAIMVLLSLVVGGPSLAEMANDDPEKMFGLTGHMAFGLVIGILMLVRLVTRILKPRPPAADTGNAILNLGAKLAHWGLYVLVLAMVASGIGIAVTADLFSIVFGSSGAPLPADFNVFPPRVAHGIISTLLLILILLHVAGWAYHQFYLRDGLLSRMWYAKRGEQA